MWFFPFSVWLALRLFRALIWDIWVYILTFRKHEFKVIENKRFETSEDRKLIMQLSRCRYCGEPSYLDSPTLAALPESKAYCPKGERVKFLKVISAIFRDGFNCLAPDQPPEKV